MLAIFDLDGTLIDTPSGIADCLGFVGEQFSIKNDRDFLRRTVGKPLRWSIAQVIKVGEDDPKVDEGMRLYQEAFRDLVLPRAKKLIYPGVLEHLARLKNSKIPMVVGTNKFKKSAEVLLRESGLLHYFRGIYGADQVLHPKPAPDLGFLIMNSEKKGAGECFMVGDSLSDLHFAKSLGFESLMVSYGVETTGELEKEKPTAIFDSFADVTFYLMKKSMAWGAGAKVSSHRERTGL